MKKINMLTIRIDGGTQVRESLNQTKVDEYAEMMRDGDVFPPITVFHDGSDYWLSSGFHRYFANKQIGNTAIDAIVKDGTVDDALFFALGDNKHGLNHNDADNRKAVMIMLNHKKWSSWSNAQIAKHIGVNRSTVGRIKQSLEVVEPEVKTYVNKHGQESKMKTTNIGKPTKPAPTTKPDLSTISDDQMEIKELKEKITELSDVITQLDEENKALRDIIAAQRWDASEFEIDDIQETVSDLRDQIKVLEVDNKALRESRDMFQHRNVELLRTVKAMQKKK